MDSAPKGPALKTAAAVAAAFGLLIASTAMSRVEGSGFGGDVTTIARAAALFELFVMAWFFRHEVPPIRRVMAFGCFSAAVYVLLYCLQLAGLNVGVGSTGLEMSQLVGLFCGLSEGTFVILLCFLFAVQPPRYGAVSVAAGCFLFDVLTAVATVVPPGATPCVKLLCLAGGVAALFGSLRMVSSSDAVLPEGRLLARGSDGQVRTSRRVPLGQKAGYLSCVTVFPFLYGVAMQVVNASGLGTYNVFYQAIVSLVVAALLVYVTVRGGSLQSGSMLLLAAPVIFAAYVLIAVAPGGAPFAVGLLSRIDYSVCQLVFIVVLARMAHSSIGETCYYTALFYGTLKLAALLGREFASGVLPLPLGQRESVVVALAALGMLIACCVTVALSGRRGPDDPTAVPETAGAGVGDLAGAPGKVERFAEFYGLSARETEILRGFAKGFNMASIGEEIGISASTVGTYMHRIYVKAGVDGKQGLAERYDEFAGSRP